MLAELHTDTEPAVFAQVPTELAMLDWIMDCYTVRALEYNID